MSHLSIAKFREYQHYRDRKPLWIKLHVKILEDETFLSWDTPTRLLALLLLPVAANRDNRIPNNPVWIGVEVGMPSRLVAKSLARLLADSYLISSVSASESAPTETETENRVTSSNGYVLPTRALTRLLSSLPDKDPATERTIRTIAGKHRLAEGDFMWALECATGPGVNSPTRVAVAELKKRGLQKDAA